MNEFFTFLWEIAKTYYFLTIIGLTFFALITLFIAWVEERHWK